ALASWPQVTAPTYRNLAALVAVDRRYRGLATVDRSYRWLGRGRSSLQADSMQVVTPQPVSSATIAANRYNKCV
ncbi:hypothetical protein BHE74_00026525, partial [Ensete ventricosum]